MAVLRQLLVITMLVYMTSAASLSKLDRDMKELKARVEALENKREIWDATEITSNSALIHLQRTTQQTNQNGYWMLEYKTMDGSKPSAWTKARTDFHRWNDDEISEDVNIGGKIKRVGGLVRLTGLRPATVYNLRTRYSTQSDGSNSEVEPASGSNRLFETLSAAESKKSLDTKGRSAIESLLDLMNERQRRLVW